MIVLLLLMLVEYLTVNFTSCRGTLAIRSTDVFVQYFQFKRHKGLNIGRLKENMTSDSIDKKFNFK